MNIKLIYISNNKNNNIELLVEDYEKKINHFISYSSIGLKNKNQKTEKKLTKQVTIPNSCHCYNRPIYTYWYVSISRFFTFN